MTPAESILEEAALEWFGELGYAVGHGPDMAPGKPASRDGGRDSFGEVVLVGRLLNAMRQINPTIPDDAREEALCRVLRLDFPSLVSANLYQSRTFATLRVPTHAGLPKLLSGELGVASSANLIEGAD